MTTDLPELPEPAAWGLFTDEQIVKHGLACWNAAIEAAAHEAALYATTEVGRLIAANIRALTKGMTK